MIWVDFLAHAFGNTLIININSNFSEELADKERLSMDLFRPDFQTEILVLNLFAEQKHFFVTLLLFDLRHFCGRDNLLLNMLQLQFCVFINALENLFVLRSFIFFEFPLEILSPFSCLFVLFSFKVNLMSFGVQHGKSFVSGWNSCEQCSSHFFVSLLIQMENLLMFLLKTCFESHYFLF